MYDYKYKTKYTIKVQCIVSLHVDIYMYRVHERILNITNICISI